jgi:hypothetical protein
MTRTGARRAIATGLALALTLALTPAAAGQDSRADASREPSSAGSPAVFFDVLGGKDRRVRPTEDTDRAFAQCSPLVGLKVGIAKRFRNRWELAGAVGAAVRLVKDDRMARESEEFFADAEVNRYLAGGAFIGTGLSLWDLTLSGGWTPAWVLHFGLPLSRNTHHPAFFVGEGRLFFDHIDNVANNYQVWGGVRVQFRR